VLQIGCWFDLPCSFGTEVLPINRLKSEIKAYKDEVVEKIIELAPRSQSGVHIFRSNVKHYWRLYSTYKSSIYSLDFFRVVVLAFALPSRSVALVRMF
jgi:hypothetical protein